jgi:hypothetical protein
MSRALVSTASNIAEGTSRRIYKDFGKFVKMAWVATLNFRPNLSSPKNQFRGQNARESSLSRKSLEGC